MSIAALKFETANRHRHSACRVALVRVLGGRVVERFSSLIRTEGPFEAAQVAVHGLTAADVALAPTFRELWPLLSALLNGATRLVAHHAAFDRSVLEASLREAGLPVPVLEVECTLARARRLLDLPNHRLATVCAAQGVPAPARGDTAGAALAAALLAERLDAWESRALTFAPATLPAQPGARRRALELARRAAVWAAAEAAVA